MWFGQVKIESSELKWQYMRASGAGGQGVNTADSAVSQLVYEDDIGSQCCFASMQRINIQKQMDKGVTNMLYLIE